MLEEERIKAAIESGETYLGLELGSTRIKAVLTDSGHRPIASGSHTWENRLEDNLWTYGLDDIWGGLRSCYAMLADDVLMRYGSRLTAIGALGVSGMMHGYMAFDQAGRLLVPFRTWRNTNTGKASAALTGLFGFNIPQRWSIAHLYQAMLDSEAHVPDIAFMTTLAGYIHWLLTGRKTVGIGEASGMFPIDAETEQFDTRMTGVFDKLAAERALPWRLSDILPDVLPAGENAGYLTETGARRLDPSGTLSPGIPVCPPEGDAGTGMVATNSVARHTGNISAGTSIFAMIVLDGALRHVYPEIDLVTTPSGDPVAMVHCNNCTSDIDAWAGMFGEFAEAAGVRLGADALYSMLYGKALDGDNDCGGLLAYNYFSGEPVTGFVEGRPLIVRPPDGRLTLGNLMRAQLFAALGALKIGMEILFEGESIRLSSITGHGGFFKVPGVGQRLMAAALKTPVTVMRTAGEGGPWGMAILAAYMMNKQPGETLERYLADRVVKSGAGTTVNPERELVESFENFMIRYRQGLAVERAAIELL